MSGNAQLAALALLISLGGGTASAWLVLKSPQRDPAGWVTAESLQPQPLEESPRFGRPFALPLGRNEGTAVVAVLDAEGKPLDAACDYRVAGRFPPSSLWTLAAVSRRDPAIVSALPSFQTLREPDGSDAVTVSSHPSPGNWLELGAKTGSFTLTLTLYGSAINDGTGFTDLRLPRIETLRCDD